jgi:hypothetical protein
MDGSGYLLNKPPNPVASLLEFRGREYRLADRQASGIAEP